MSDNGSFQRPSARFSAKNVDFFKSETVFDGYFEVRKHHIRHEKFNGSVTEDFTREVFERGHAVAIIPYDPVRDEVLLIEQFRASIASRGEHPWSIEIPAGIIEKGESIDDVARRELREETGLEAQEMRRLFRVYTTPGGSTETAQYFYARIDASLADGFHGVEGEQEDIAVFTLPLDDALALIETGDINNAFVLIALQWLALNRNVLRQTD